MATLDRAKQNLEHAKENVGRLARDVMQNDSQREGSLTQSIEQQTAKLPSISFLGLAVASMIGSALITVFSERKEYGNFVGLWAPSFLMMGIYNKIVKLQGSDRYSENQSRKSA